MPTSIGPAPMPPYSSANGRPSTPISASCGHTFSLKPGSSATALRRFSKSEYALPSQAADGLAQRLLLVVVA